MNPILLSFCRVFRYTNSILLLSWIAMKRMLLPFCWFNSETPERGLAVYRSAGSIRPAPCGLQPCENTEAEICFREAKYAATAGSAGPTFSNLIQASFWQLNPLIFLAFCCNSLHGADPAAIMPASMPYQADFAAILPANMRYEADSDAMLHDFFYEADHAAILLL